MPGTQIIGRVAVKVLPNTDEFRPDAERQLNVIEKALRDVKVVIKPNLDMSGVAAQARKVRETAAKQLDAITLRVKMDDQGSVQRAITRLRAELDALDEKEIRVKLDRADLTSKLGALEKQLASIATLDLKVRPGSASSLQRAVAKIDAELEKLAEIDLKVKMDKASLEKARKDLQAQLDAATTVYLRVNKGSVSSLQSTISKIDAELEKLREVEIKVKPDRASLEKAKAELERNLKIHQDLELAVNYAKADEIRKRVQARLDGVSIAPTLDQAAVQRTMRQIEAHAEKIEQLKAQIKPELDSVARRKLEREIEEIEDRISNLTAEIHTDVNALSEKASRAKLAAMTRARRVEIIVDINKASAARVSAVLASLSGARVAANWIRQLGQALSDLDKNVPIIGSIALAIAGLAGWALTAVSNLFTLSASLAQIGGAALALPGIFGGIAVGVGVAIAVLKDFNEVLPEVKTRLSSLQDQLSERFWKVAEAPIRRLVDDLFPSLEKGAGRTADALGGFFANLSNSLRKALGADVLGGMFDSLVESIRLAGKGTDAYAGILAKLGTVGSSYLPRLAQWFVDISQRLDDFLGQASADGRLQTWIDNGIQALADLGTIIVQVGRIFLGMTKAAEAAGGSTLSTLADKLTRIADIVNGERFQSGMTDVFRAAHQAMDLIATISGPAVTRLLETLGRTLTAILPVVGEALGTLLDNVATALSHPAFQGALVLMFEALRDALAALGPAFGPVAVALGKLAILVGEIARVLGPLAAEVLGTLAEVVIRLAPSVTRLVGVLGDGLLRVTEALSPVLLRVADALARAADTALVPALTTAINGLVPVLERLLPLIGDALVTALTSLTSSDLLPKLAELFVQMVGVWGGMVERLLPELVKLIPLVADALARITEAVTPLLPGFAELATLASETLVPAFVAFALEVLPALVGAIVKVAEVIAPMVSKGAEAARVFREDVLPAARLLASFLGENLASVLTGLADVFSGAFVAMKGSWDVFAGFLTADWDRVWRGIKEIGQGIWSMITGTFATFMGVNLLAPLTSGLGKMRELWSSGWEDMRQKSRDAWRLMADAARDGVNSVIDWVRGIPDRIVAALGPLGQLLVDAGHKVIDGFLAGLRSAFGRVKAALAELTALLPDWKGPAPRDRTILRGAGQLVIDGFIDGLESRYDAVRKSLRGLTDDVADTDFAIPGVDAPGVSRRAAGLADGALAGSREGAQKVLNYYAAPGSSISSEEDLFAAAGRARMGW
ncbi:hypothetical protein [Lentzea sp. NEAU-D7]|uniref:hypothetical protein n=1 Tax=Lentzea sp. NEAU-D7 TaxID=2994667 RepID=UPI00224AB683|nr:hypothetical protein [Lentzea sp. NEAU-D7]MCX2949940.1 hypothetical protein [Lentzea sp. NEAU-D7]